MYGERQNARLIDPSWHNAKCQRAPSTRKIEPELTPWGHAVISVWLNRTNSPLASLSERSVNWLPTLAATLKAQKGSSFRNRLRPRTSRTAAVAASINFHGIIFPEIPQIGANRDECSVAQCRPARLIASDRAPTKTRLKAQLASRLNQLRDKNLRPK